MSNQPPVRPWFRLAPIRSAAPTPAPAAPGPRPPLTIPSTFRNITSTPSEPTPPPPPSAPAPPAAAALPPPAPAPAPFTAAAPPPLAPPVTAAQFTADRLPPSPTTRAAQPPTTSPNKTTVTSRGVSPPDQDSPPRTIKPEVQSLNPSRNQKTTTPPSSPQTLPTTQLQTRSEVEPRILAELEAEPKTVVVQESIEKPMSWTTKNGEVQREPGTGHSGKQLPSGEFESKEKHFHRKVSDPKKSGMRVITIAGENRGASMDIIRSSKKHESKNLHKDGGTKTRSGGVESEGSGDEDGKAAGNNDNKSWRGKAVSSSFPMTAFMNSNVQPVNNSIMFNASCENNDPGVHLSLTKKPSRSGLGSRYN